VSCTGLTIGNADGATWTFADIRSTERGGLRCSMPALVVLTLLADGEVSPGDKRKAIAVVFVLPFVPTDQNARKLRDDDVLSQHVRPCRWSRASVWKTGGQGTNHAAWKVTKKSDAQCLVTGS